jgi:hypothetical protein
VQIVAADQPRQVEAERAQAVLERPVVVPEALPQHVAVGVFVHHDEVDVAPRPDRLGGPLDRRRQLAREAALRDHGLTLDPAPGDLEAGPCHQQHAHQRKKAADAVEQPLAPADQPHQQDDERESGGQHDEMRRVGGIPGQQIRRPAVAEEPSDDQQGEEGRGARRRPAAKGQGRQRVHDAAGRQRHRDQEDQIAHPVLVRIVRGEVEGRDEGDEERVDLRHPGAHGSCQGSAVMR